MSVPDDSSPDWQLVEASVTGRFNGALHCLHPRTRVQVCVGSGMGRAELPAGQGVLPKAPGGSLSPLLHSRGGCPAHLHGLHSRGGVPRPPAWLTQQGGGTPPTCMAYTTTAAAAASPFLPMQVCVPFTPCTGPRLMVRGDLGAASRRAVMRAMGRALISIAGEAWGVRELRGCRRHREGRHASDGASSDQHRG